MNLLNNSKLSDHNASVIVTSFYAHGVSFVEVVKDYMNQETALAFTSVRNFVIGLIWIVISVVSCSTTGPLTLSIPAIDPYIASAWRTQASFVFILPIIMYMNNPELYFKK
jgi:hypothetical protein